MDEFTEVKMTDAEEAEFAETEKKYRYVGDLDFIASFYMLWGRVENGDFDAYNTMITGFPSEWLTLAPPDWFICDESMIPAEHILYPDGVDDPTERHDARMVLVPDQHAISAWLSDRADS